MKHRIIDVLQIFIIVTTFQNCKSGYIAEMKCNEYAKAVYVEKARPVLARNFGKVLQSECGIVSVPLIIGGTKASEKEFPHMAVIGFGHSATSKLAWNCGGALISELFILTAAHCIESRELGPAQAVRLGIINIDDTEELQERAICERIPYPEYSPITKKNDIALLKMVRPVEFTAFVRPACLNNNEKEVSLGRRVLASGFGKINYNNDIGSKDLMKVTLTVYEKNVCSKVLKSRESMNSVLCVGELKGGKDTCQGDSGGPLQIVLRHPYCMYSLIGVTSFGKFCGFANSPAIYSRVSSFVPWIEKNVWNYSYLY